MAEGRACFFDVGGRGIEIVLEFSLWLPLQRKLSVRRPLFEIDRAGNRAISDGIEPVMMNGRLMLNMPAPLAEYEREGLIEHVTAGTRK
ncbi:recombinase family protein [Cryobacterium sp. Y11]|uniref:recombinase family protein n=1 Tax=Cryobacterium sp. Y11 TaxID=2045016 RepID=UPI0011B0D5A1